MTRASLASACGLLALSTAACGVWPGHLNTVAGTVFGPDGAPVPGAVVTDGRASVLSAEDGRFALASQGGGLTVRKPGYVSAALGPDGGEARLVARPEVPRVGVDDRGAPGELSGLRAHLAGAGLAVAAYPETPSEALDVLILVAPGSLSGAEGAALRRWVRAGGRLVVAGEWGGYPGQDLDGMNALVEEAGIRFTGGTMRVAGAEGGTAWLSLAGLRPASLARLAGDGPLVLFGATTLALAPPATAIVSAREPAYTVLAGDRPVAAAVGPFGAGKVFAVADSSLWRDADSAADGTPNWRRGANAGLAVALARW